MKFTKTNKLITEYDLDSLFEYNCKKNGSKGHAYVPVVASGHNALAMHYVYNDMQLK